ncbi:MAG: hypothetical protein IT577_20085 [Verrucomicrobiae bacterium]|nr:hypothetical protein [Verrucomicrobiae bacterium]
MNSDTDLTDAIYRQVGEEIAQKVYHPGTLAKAIAEAAGNRSLVESLYVRFRFDELVRSHQRAAQEHKQKAEAEDRQQGIYTCPACGHRGKLLIKEHGSEPIGFLLTLCFIIPGVIYSQKGFWSEGVCANCRCTLVPRLNDTPS